MSEDRPVYGKDAHVPPEIEGMPPGIKYIVGNEAAERFSFYGMRAILTVFMTQHLINADGARAVMSDGEAKTWYHTFVMAAYFFPIFGAIISDWLLGKYKTILFISIVYCLGHLALALDETRLGLTVGLTLIAIGTGAIKPCVSAHVGDQFGTRNKHLLSKVFGWFYIAINVGAFLSTILTPYLLSAYGANVAFGVPGLLMLIATIVFWLGRNTFVHVPAKGDQFFKESFGPEGLSAIRRLVPIYIFVAAFWCLFDQTGSAWVIQADSMDRMFLWNEWSSSQFQAVNPFFIVILVPIMSYWLFPMFDGFFPLTPLRKITIGMFMTVSVFAISAFIESQITGGKVVQHQANPATKDQESDKVELSSTSTSNPELYGANKLLDGEMGSGQHGWISKTLQKDEDGKIKGELFPQRVAIRLRERSAWEIDTVRIHPAVKLSDYQEELRDKKKIDEFPTDTHYYPKDVEVFVSDSPVKGWKSVGTLKVGETQEAYELNFDAVEAEYVMLEITSNWGADAVAMGEVEVLAVGELTPEMASSSTAYKQGRDVWPNVATTGFRPSIGWQIFAYLILTAAEVLVSITCLEFSYTQSPNAMKSVIMSLYLLSVTLGNLIAASVNAWTTNADGTSTLPGESYYWFFAVMMFAAAVGFVFVAMFYKEKTYIQGEDKKIIEAEAGAEGTMNE